MEKPLLSLVSAA